MVTGPTVVALNPVSESALRAASRAAVIVDLIRVRNMRLPLGLFVVASLRGGASLGRLIPGIVLLIAGYGVASIVNDLSDLRIDEANGRSLPLVQGKVSLGEARLILLTLVSLVAATSFFLVNLTGVGIVLFALTCSMLYSIPGVRLSDRGLLGPFVLAGMYCIVPLALALTETGGTARPQFLWIPLLLLGMAMVMYKDIADEPGDRAFAKLTPVVRYGAPAVQKAVVALMITGGATAAVDEGFGLWLVALCLGLCVSLWVVRSGVHGVAIEGHRLATTVAVLLLVSGL